MFCNECDNKNYIKGNVCDQCGAAVHHKWDGCMDCVHYTLGLGGSDPLFTYCDIYINNHKCDYFCGSYDEYKSRFNNIKKRKKKCMSCNYGRHMRSIFICTLYKIKIDENNYCKNLQK